jgi:hypothetical protein
MTAPKPTARIKGGIPNVPKGETVIAPLNPWGRAMPKPERQPRPALWQVHVRDKHFGKVIPVAPSMGREFAEMLKIKIAEQIASGAERRWSNPHLVMHLPRTD